MTESNNTETVHLNLLDNGIDFILTGIDDLFDDDLMIKKYPDYINPERISLRSYKYGTLHLFSGFLLLLKERIARHHACLIFVKSKDNHNKRSPTVNFRQAKKILKDVLGYEFTEGEMKVITSMQDRRNDFEHYNIEVNRYKLWSTISSFLDLIDQYLVQELSVTLETAPDGQKLLQKIQQIESVWQRVKQQKKQQLLEDMTLKQNDLLQEGREQVRAGLQNHYISEKGIEEVFISCPECGKDSLIVYGEFTGICLDKECDNVFPMTHCLRCEMPIVGWEWDEDLCAPCQEWLDRE